MTRQQSQTQLKRTSSVPRTPLRRALHSTVLLLDSFASSVHEIASLKRNGMYEQKTLFLKKLRGGFVILQT